MRKVIFVFVVLCCASLVNAQEKSGRHTEGSEIRTLFTGDGVTEHGAYGAVNLYYGGMGVGSNYRSAFVSGVRGAWVMDHVFELGIDANGIVSEPKFDPEYSMNQYFYTGGFGGLYMAFNLFPENPINVSIPLTIGGGAISYVGNFQSYGQYYDYYPERLYAFFMVQPGLELQVNLLKFMRVALHASYRMTSNIYSEYSVAPQGLNDENIMRGLNAGISLKFGKF